MNLTTIWVILLGMTVITLSERLSFMGLLANRRIPDLLLRALRFVPAAALTAIVVPDLLYRNGEVVDPLSNLRLMAAMVAAVVAFRTKNVLLTIVAGMSVLWVLQALTGQ
ncbi:MAG: AzlD domain-containing protein [Anaerolineae bacterium]|nr:AzlD domain-containing protein [Anaerolineae bacterium]